MDAHEKLLADLRALGSAGLSMPSETIGLVLTAAKRMNPPVPWEMAWNQAINAAASPSISKRADPALAEASREDRAILAECKPAFRAAYEGAVDRVERDTAIAAARAERRLADVDVPTRDEFPSLNGNALRDAA